MSFLYFLLKSVILLSVYNVKNFASCFFLEIKYDEMLKCRYPAQGMLMRTTGAINRPIDPIDPNAYYWINVLPRLGIYSTKCEDSKTVHCI